LMEFSNAIAGQTSYTFYPLQPVSILNPYRTALNLNCKISAWNAAYNFEILGLTKTTTVNDHIVVAGTSLLLTVTHGIKLTINFESGAEIRVINQGNNNVIADCNN
jgi:hypothetical protein